MAGSGTREVLTVGAEEAGERLDRFLARRLPDFSRSRLQALIRAGRVARDGAAVADLGHRIKAGETYSVDVPEPEPATPQAAGHAARDRPRGRRTSSSSTSRQA